MKFYVAGKKGNWQAPQLMNTLEGMGHEITWAECVEFVLLLDGRGDYIDALIMLGISLGNGRLCYIVGDELRSGLFKNHPLCIQHDTVEEFLDEIKSIYKVGG